MRLLFGPNAVELNGVSVQTSKCWYKCEFTFENLITLKQRNDYNVF